LHDGVEREENHGWRHQISQSSHKALEDGRYQQHALPWPVRVFEARLDRYNSRLGKTNTPSRRYHL
jgi:antitoxin component HigA of HigAB toxin-antitoxin module